MTAHPGVTGKKTGRRLLTYQDLRARGIPWSRVHITRLEAARKFPLHVDLGENTVAWFEDEIDDLLEVKAAERNAKAAARDATDSSITDSDCDRPLGHAREHQKPVATTKPSVKARTTLPGHTHQEDGPGG
jgi:prophage regulatory protein